MCNTAEEGNMHKNEMRPKADIVSNAIIWRIKVFQIIIFLDFCFKWEDFSMIFFYAVLKDKEQ